MTYLLATLLGEAEDNADPQPTTGTAGYAAASTEPPELFSMAAVAKMVTDAVAKAVKDLPPAAGRQKPTSEGATSSCWTHGPCAHSSQECKQPKEGHVWTATAGTNRQGGANVCFSKKM